MGPCVLDLKTNDSRAATLATGTHLEEILFSAGCRVLRSDNIGCRDRLTIMWPTESGGEHEALMDKAQTSSSSVQCEGSSCN